MVVVSALVVPAHDVLLRLAVPDGWASGPLGSDTVLWDDTTPGAFRTNVVVRVHEVGAAVALEALVAFVDDELDERDAAGAEVERRGRTELELADGRGVAVLANLDARDALDARGIVRVAQLHAFVEAAPSPEDAAASRPVFHLVATGALADAAAWRGAVVEIVSGAAVRRGTRAAPR